MKGQAPEKQLGSFNYDSLADTMRQDAGGELLVHYMAPLVDDGEVFLMSRGASQWVSCRSGQVPCGAARWNQMEWGVTRLITRFGDLRPTWTTISTWKPAPDNGSGWEPVFHPVLSGRSLYMPAAGGGVLQLDRHTGVALRTIQPFGETNETRYVTSPLTVDENGTLFYTVMRLDPQQPWSGDVREAWLVKVDHAGVTSLAAFRDLLPQAPAQGCETTFAGTALPWPPSGSARPPLAPCGGQRPGLNVTPAIAPDGTVYLVSRAHFNGAYGYLVAVNQDLSLKWSVSLRDRLNDGCDVLVPRSGTVGGCRSGSTRGVDPATNGLPAGVVNDLSTASPAVAPDGSILYGAYTRYNYARGHMFHFDRAGSFLGTYDFGWDITPAIYPHDGTWSVILKDNHYPLGSYCSTFGLCGEGDERYDLTSLTADLRPEWKYPNTSEWCVNMVAVDRAGVVYANSEDGSVYAIDAAGNLVGKLFLKLALGAAYTPIALGADGRIFTQNDGTLFLVGSTERPFPLF